MPTGADTWVEATGPTFEGNPDSAPVAFGEPGAGAAPETAPYVKVAPSEDFDTAQIVVSDTAVQIAARETSRRTLELRNFDTKTVYIGRSAAAVNAGEGYPLEQGERKLLETKREVWAICGTGDTTTVALLAEYEVEVVTS